MRSQLQVHLSWAESQPAAEQQALAEWPTGGMPFPKQDIRNPEDFANIARLVRLDPDTQQHARPVVTTRFAYGEEVRA